jgi:hypothetical protein
MRALSGTELLELWEKGRGLHPLDRTLLVLSTALPGIPPETLPDWVLGRRNRSLFELHCSCFGSRLSGWAGCAQCGEKMEFELDSRELMTHNQSERCEATVAAGSGTYRLPTSRDLAAVADERDPDAVAIRLLQRCRVTSDETSVGPAEGVEHLGELMALADPMAETRLALRCPTCGHESEEVLDIATFVWAEIESRAKRLLWEVHALASVYGWSEAQIFSLSTVRRAAYLEMVQA